MNKCSRLREEEATGMEHASPPTYSGCVDYGAGLMIASPFGRTLNCDFLLFFLLPLPLADRERDGE